ASTPMATATPASRRNTDTPTFKSPLSIVRGKSTEIVEILDEVTQATPPVGWVSGASFAGGALRPDRWRPAPSPARAGPPPPDRPGWWSRARPAGWRARPSTPRGGAWPGPGRGARRGSGRGRGGEGR